MLADDHTHVSPLRLLLYVSDATFQCVCVRVCNRFCDIVQMQQMKTIVFDRKLMSHN